MRTAIGRLVTEAELVATDFLLRRGVSAVDLRMDGGSLIR